MFQQTIDPQQIKETLDQLTRESNDQNSNYFTINLIMRRFDDLHHTSFSFGMNRIYNVDDFGKCLDTYVVDGRVSRIMVSGDEGAERFKSKPVYRSNLEF